MSCERLSDRMPAVMAGRDHWNREDQEHLAVCSDCRSEWQLLAAWSEVERARGNPEAAKLVGSLVAVIR